MIAASFVPFSINPCTASRCTSGSESASSGTSSLRPSAPPNSRSRKPAVRRISQLCALSSGRTASAPARPEPDQQIAEMLPRPRVLLGREHLGERHDHRWADGVADVAESLVALVVLPTAGRRDVLDERSFREPLERAAAWGCRNGLRSPCSITVSIELPRLIEVADADQIVGVGDRPCRRRRASATDRFRCAGDRSGDPDRGCAGPRR